MTGERSPRPRRGLPDADRRRLRQSWRVLAVGGAVAVLAAVVAGLAGLPGQVGVLALLVVGALALAVTAIHALALALVDDMKDRGVARRRPLIAGGLLLLAGVLMAMAGGVTAS